jgi:4-diphosphocytidyl-2-C-methyl-D-erythritol kinase
VEAVFEALARVGTPQLTGTGSGCFVAFGSRDAAEAARAALPRDVDAWIAAGATRSPLLDALASSDARAGDGQRDPG